MSRTVFYCRCGARLEGASERLSHHCEEPTEERMAHDARVVDWCYGWTGGVKIRCSCGDYWVLGRDATDFAVERSIERHKSKKAASPESPS